MTRRPDHHARLDKDQPWRAWYKTARWQRLKLQAHIRDKFTCRRTGIILIGKHPAPDSPVANHIVPHKGDPALFWNLDNIETIAKALHDSQVQSQEKAAYLKGTDANGRPLDPNHPWNRAGGACQT